MTSMMAGNMSPKVERQTAPTREMKGPRFGMAAAMPTEKWEKTCQDHDKNTI